MTWLYAFMRHGTWIDCILILIPTASLEVRMDTLFNHIRVMWADSQLLQRFVYHPTQAHPLTNLLLLKAVELSSIWTMQSS